MYIYFEEGATPSDATPNDAVLNFDSGDSNTYTVTAVPDSSAQQTVLVLYDIRNILIIFLFVWFLISIYYRLKNTIKGYFS